MTSKLTKIVLSVALMAFLATAAGCDEREWGSSRDRYGSWSDAFFNFDFFGSDCCGYEVYDEYYVEETYVETGYYDGYDVYYDDGGYYYDDGYYYGDDWKGKKPG